MMRRVRKRSFGVERRTKCTAEKRNREKQSSQTKKKKEKKRESETDNIIRLRGQTNAHPLDI